MLTIFINKKTYLNPKLGFADFRQQATDLITTGFIDSFSRAENIFFIIKNESIPLLADLLKSFINKSPENVFGHVVYYHVNKSILNEVVGTDMPLFDTETMLYKDYLYSFYPDLTDESKVYISGAYSLNSNKYIDSVSKETFLKFHKKFINNAQSNIYFFHEINK